MNGLPDERGGQRRRLRRLVPRARPRRRLHGRAGRGPARPAPPARHDEVQPRPHLDAAQRRRHRRRLPLRVRDGGPGRLSARRAHGPDLARRRRPALAPAPLRRAALRARAADELARAARGQRGRHVGAARRARRLRARRPRALPGRQRRRRSRPSAPAASRLRRRARAPGRATPRSYERPPCTRCRRRPRPSTGATSTPRCAPVLTVALRRPRAHRGADAPRRRRARPAHGRRHRAASSRRSTTAAPARTC